MILIRNHSHYSLLQSTSKPADMCKYAKDMGYDCVGLTDVSTVSGCVSFLKECKKNDLKPIIGTDIELKEGGFLTILCRNHAGWVDLLNLISIANAKDNYKNGPKLPFSDLLSVNLENFVCIDGYVGSSLFNKSIKDINCFINASTYEQGISCINAETKRFMVDHIDNMREVFPHYYVEINNADSDTFPLSKILHDVLTSLSIDDILIPDTSTFYTKKQDSIDHRVMMCVRLKTTLQSLESKIVENQDLSSLKFIRSSQYYIRPRDEVSKSYEDQHLSNIMDIRDLCEDIKILSQPQLPNFPCPDNLSQQEYLKKLCFDNLHKIPQDKYDVYMERLEHELDVIYEANLSGYFLIVQDYVNHFRNKGCLVGPGRGSGGGSLVCYLTGITLIDPLKYNLLFARFYNKGRNTKDNVSLPDIDIDFPPEWRDEVIDYIKQTYGSDRVCQMVTFGRMRGRSILQEILRVNNACTYEVICKITDNIEAEDKISDQLEKMDDPSSIMWSLEHKRDALMDYCWIDDNHELQGEYARYFQQAVRMEGLYKTQGKHAAGLVISLMPLSSVCPMVKASRGDELVAGMEMGDLEAIGCVKFDILGVSCLGKIARSVGEINEKIMF